MTYGYIRASIGLQSEADQRQALQAAGCTEIVQEQDVAKDWPELNRIVGGLGPGDLITVTSLDRIARSVPQLIAVLVSITGQGAHVRSLREVIDTRTIGVPVEHVSHLLKNVLAAEREFLVERVQAGRANAMRKGAKLGRRNKLTSDQVQHAKRLLEFGEGGSAVARTFGVSEATMYRNIRNLKVQG